MNSEHDKGKELFSDMQLPDMEKSWEQMKQKLQEDKDRRKPLFYWPLKGGVLLLILLFIGAGAGWWFLSDSRNKKSTERSSAAPSDQLPVSVSSPKGSDGKATIPGMEPGATTENKNNNTNDINLPPGNTNAGRNQLPDQISSNLAAPSNNAVATPITRPVSKNKINRSVHVPNSKTKNTDLTGYAKAKSRTRIINSSADGDQIPAPTTAALAKAQPLAPDSSAVITKVTTTSPSTELADTATKKTEPTTITAAAKPNHPASKKSLQFSMGLGLQKQVPLGGQSGVGYNYSGQSSTLTDHLPSLYIRMEKEKKWFLDAEFHYGSPQLLQSFSYSRQTSLQDSGTVLSTKSFNIEKTYYHRLPISLNVYLKPRWSVGAGMEYSLFHGAISRKTVTNKSLLSGTTGSNSEMVFVKQFNDSFLYKSQVRLIFQSMYQWKRFSFGIRYSADMEPYIRFTTPEGEVRDRRSNSLQMLVRYRMVK